MDCKEHERATQMTTYLKARKDWDEAAKQVGKVPIQYDSDDSEEERVTGIKRPYKAVIHLDEFVKVIDQHIGNKFCPILDIVSWHLQRVDDNIITYTKN